MLVRLVLFLLFVPVSAASAEFRFNRSVPPIVTDSLARGAMPLPDTEVRIEFGSCWGCASPTTPPFIGIRMDQQGAARALFHEIGHVFDYVEMSALARERFMAIMREHRPWRSPPNSPHEQFAEAYSRCSIPPRPSTPHIYGYAPTRSQHRRVCHLIRSVGLS